jgi:hypothetical protein
LAAAADSNREEIAALLTESAARAQIVAAGARRQCAGEYQDGGGFGELFNSAYWASRPYRGTEDHLAGAARRWRTISSATTGRRYFPPPGLAPAGSTRSSCTDC